MKYTFRRFETSEWPHRCHCGYSAGSPVEKFVSVDAGPQPFVSICMSCAEKFLKDDKKYQLIRAYDATWKEVILMHEFFKDKKVTYPQTGRTNCRTL